MHLSPQHHGRANEPTGDSKKSQPQIQRRGNDSSSVPVNPDSCTPRSLFRIDESGLPVSSTAVSTVPLLPKGGHGGRGGTAQRVSVVCLEWCARRRAPREKCWGRLPIGIYCCFNSSFSQKNRNKLLSDSIIFHFSFFSGF